MVTEVPGYVLREPIGTGSSATVWRGEVEGAPGRVVAVKVVTHDAGRAATDALRREGEILGRLSHPSILQVVAVVPTDIGLALVTPYASGGSLATMLAHAPGGLPAGVVADIGARLASALAAMHGAGIVHRDIKPGNVLFDRERQPLLGDAGVARLHDDAPTVGTADYLDPDLLDGRAPDPRSDLYALGITLYEALSGLPPFASATPAQTLGAADRGQFAPLGDHVDAPAALIAAIESAFARDVQDRPAGAHELAGRLDESLRTMQDESDGPPSVPGSSVGRAGVLGAVPARGVPTSLRPPRGATPAAPPDAPPGPRVQRRIPRALLVVAAVAVVLVAAGVVIAGVTGADTAGTVDLEASGDRGTAGPGTGADQNVADGSDTTAEVGPPVGPPDGSEDSSKDGPSSESTPRAVAPLCAGVSARDDGRDILLADVTGLGCSSSIAWDGRQLEVLGDDGSAQRYDLGAGPDDVLLFGDWTCDGRDAPALYRPQDGQLFTFDEVVGTGDQISVTGAPTGVTNGTPVVVTDDGCDRVEVSP